MVYLIKNETNNTCKIGFSKNPKNRFSTLQTASPEKLELLLEINGSFKDEKLIHKKFSSLRLEREWFSYTEDIYNYMLNYKPIVLEKTKSRINFLAIKEDYQTGYNCIVNKEILQLSDSTLKFYLILPLVKQRENTLIFVKDLKEELSEILNISIPILEKCLRELCQKGLIERISTSTYKINNFESIKPSTSYENFQPVKELMSENYINISDSTTRSHHMLYTTNKFFHKKFLVKIDYVKSRCIFTRADIDSRVSPRKAACKNNTYTCSIFSDIPTGKYEFEIDECNEDKLVFYF